MNQAILQSITDRGITRLCHFTPSRNLVHIALSQVGILSTASLQADERAAFNQTDLSRLDGKKSHICCSIQYPNAWYFSTARVKEKLFTDWVVLLISPQYLADENTLFCPRNAAADYGRYITSGQDGFDSLFSASVSGAGGFKRGRTNTHRPNCPTDEQAEVLIYDHIVLKDIVGVAVESPEQAAAERVRLRLNGVDPDQFEFVIAPQMFDKYATSDVIRRGSPTAESVYKP